MRTPSERVAKGVEFLDLGWPDWYTRIDLKKLELSNARACVLPQVFAAELLNYTGETLPYFVIVEKLGLGLEQQIDLGFTSAHPASRDWGVLELAWRVAIQAKLDAAKPKPLTGWWLVKNTGATTNHSGPPQGTPIAYLGQNFVLSASHANNADGRGNGCTNRKNVIFWATFPNPTNPT